MMLSSSPWWWAPVFALGWIVTVPAQSFRAPARAKSIAAARLMPGVWGVFGSSSCARTTRTPPCFQSWLIAPPNRLALRFVVPAGEDRARLAELYQDVGPLALGAPARV